VQGQRDIYFSEDTLIQPLIQHAHPNK